MRISRRQGPAPRAVHEGRHVQRPAERDRSVRSPAGPDLATEEDAGLLRPHQDVGELFDGRRVADALRRRPVVAGLRDARFGTVDLGIEDVASNLQVRWAKSAVIALPEGHRDHVGDALGRVDARGELGDRLEDVDVGQVLQRPHAVLVERALAANEEHRALRPKCIGDAGDRVGGARPGRDDGAAGPAGHAGVAISGMRGHLLVTDIHHLDALVDASIVDVDDVAPAEGEDGVDPFRLQRPGHQVAAGDRLGLRGLLRLVQIHRRLDRVADFRCDLRH